MTERSRRAAAQLGPALTLALVLSGVYLLWQPPSADLAAATYRAGLFGRAGFALYDSAWYGGHGLLSYSVLFAPLGSWLGVRLAGALAALVATACFAALTRQQSAAVWFALGISVSLLTGRIAFTLGVAAGLGALLAARSGRSAAAIGLAVVTALASPLAGAFLALAALLLPGTRLLAAAAIATVLALAIAFGEGGHEPFAPSSFWPALALLLALAALAPARWRAAALLYALACTAAFALTTPVGGNAVRLGALFGGPLAALALSERRRALLVLTPVLLYWQLQAPLRDVARATGDPSVAAGYYAPLERFLAARPGPLRIEIPFTREHWEAARVAPRFALARGWERQLDIARNPLFYDGRLTAGAYRRWLRETAVSFVALPDARLDYSALQEAELLRRGVAGLSEVWRSRHWRVFAVAGATAIAGPPAQLRRLGTQSFALEFARAGTSLVRLRFSRYWRAQGACVSRGAGGWTAVRASRPGPVVVRTSFALDRVLGDGSRCA